MTISWKLEDKRGDVQWAPHQQILPECSSAPGVAPGLGSPKEKPLRNDKRLGRMTGQEADGSKLYHRTMRQDSEKILRISEPRGAQRTFVAKSGRAAFSPAHAVYGKTLGQ